MRFLAVISIILFLLPVLVGCNLTLSPSNKMPEIHAFVHNADTSHVDQMIQGLEKGAVDLQASMEVHKIDLMDGSNDDVKEIKKSIRRSTKAIIIYPFESQDLHELLEKAHAKGISLIYLDAVQSYEIPGTYIISNNEQAGFKAGQLLAQAMGNEGEAVMLNTSSDNPKALDLENGFQKALHQYPDINIVNLFNCNGQRENTKKTLQDILAAHPNIKGVFTACPETTAAAVESIRGLNREIQVVGFNHTDETLQFINSGQLYGLVSLKSFDMGYEAVRTAVSLSLGQNVLPQIDLGFDIYTGDDTDGTGNSNSPFS